MDQVVVEKPGFWFFIFIVLKSWKTNEKQPKFNLPYKPICLLNPGTQKSDFKCPIHHFFQQSLKYNQVFSRQIKRKI